MASRFLIPTLLLRGCGLRPSQAAKFPRGLEASFTQSNHHISSGISSGEPREVSARVRKTIARRRLRYAFPEFLPDPNPLFRNKLREYLERQNMVKRRGVVDIPEFYVGSILSVTLSDPNAITEGKTTKFVGIVIDRGGTGLRSWVIVRNCIDNIGVEIRYDLYSPNIVSIETLKLETRLDDELYYLRDAPLSYSTVPVDMEPELLPEGEMVPCNDIVVPLGPLPWCRRWERYTDRLKGYKITSEFTARMDKKVATHNATMLPGWQMKVYKYDLMRHFRHTIPVEEQDPIWEEVGDFLESKVADMRRTAAKRALSKSDTMIRSAPP